MSIVGFDDIPFAALTTPPLTTVAQPAYDLGYRAAELLLRRCEQPNLRPQQAILHCQLVIRQTTAPPDEGAHVA
jgi:LacI family transcriptional regulator